MFELHLVTLFPHVYPSHRRAHRSTNEGKPCQIHTSPHKHELGKGKPNGSCIVLSKFGSILFFSKICKLRTWPNFSSAFKPKPRTKPTWMCSGVSVHVQNWFEAWNCVKMQQQVEGRLVTNGHQSRLKVDADSLLKQPLQLHSCLHHCYCHQQWHQCCCLHSTYYFATHWQIVSNLTTDVNETQVVCSIHHTHWLCITDRAMLP